MNERNKVETITQEYLILAILLVTPKIEIDIEMCAVSVFQYMAASQ